MTNVEKISSAFISQLLLSEPWSPGRLYDLSMGLQNRLEKCRSLSRRLLSEHLRPVQFLNEAITSWCTERSSRTVSELCQKLSSKGFQAASECLSSTFPNKNIVIYPENDLEPSECQNIIEKNGSITFGMQEPITNFCGVSRLEQIKQVSNDFISCRFKVVVLIGPRGVGKTEFISQLVPEMRSFLPDCRFVCINSSSTLTFMKSLKCFAVSADPASMADKPLMSIIQFILSMIQKDTERWVIIFEDCEMGVCFSEIIQYFLCCKNTHIIITTEHQGLVTELTSGTIVNLEPIPCEELSSFLRSKASCSEEAGRDFVNLVKCNITALSLCLAYIEAEEKHFHREITIEELSTLYLSGRQLIQNLDIPTRFWNCTEILTTMFIIVIGLSEAGKENAIQLLYYLTLLDASGIEIQLLESLLVPGIVSNIDEDKVHKLTKVLLNYCLIHKPTETCIKIQPSVRNALLILLSNNCKEQNEIIKKLLTKFASMMNIPNAISPEMISQALAVSKNITDKKVLEDVKVVIYKALLQLRSRCEWNELKFESVDLQDNLQGVFDTNNNVYLSIIACIGEACVRSGEIQKGQSVLEEVYPKLQAVLGDKSHATGIVANELGKLYFENKEYDKALLMHKRFLEAERERCKIEFNHNICIILGNIANILIEQCKYEEALVYLHQLREWYDKPTEKTQDNLGPENKLKLAKVYINMKNFSDALSVCEQAAEEYKNVTSCNVETTMLETRYFLVLCQFNQKDVYKKIPAIRDLRALLVDVIKVMGGQGSFVNQIRDYLCTMGSVQFQFNAAINPLIKEKLIMKRKSLLTYVT